MREHFRDRRAGFRRWLTALTWCGVAFEIGAGHLHGLFLRGPSHAPGDVQVLALFLVLLPAIASVTALVPAWRVDPVGPLDEDVAFLGQVAFVTLLVGTGIHLAVSWSKGPHAQGLVGLLMPLIRHGPPALAPLLAAAAGALALRTLSLARTGLPDQDALPVFALTCLAAAAAATLDHGRAGFRPLPWTLLAPVMATLTAVLALRLHGRGRGPRGARTRRALIACLGTLLLVGLTGIVLHGRADLGKHAALPLLGRFLVSPPVAAPAMLVVLALWGLYLVTGRDALLWWAGGPIPRPLEPRGPAL